MRKGMLALAILAALCCFALTSCGETEAPDASSEPAVSSESAASHYVPVGSDEVSETGGFTSVDPEAYPSGVQCE